MVNDDDSTNPSDPSTSSHAEEARDDTPDASWWEAVSQSEDVADFEAAELLHDMVGIGVRVDSGNDVEISRGLEDFASGCCHDGTVPSSQGTSTRGRADKTLTGLTRLV